MSRRFSQSGLVLVGAAILAVMLFGLRFGMSWYRQEQVREVVRGLGGETTIRDSPAWLKSVIGWTAATKICNTVIEIDLQKLPVQNRDLEFLSAAPELELLQLHYTSLTDDGLIFLSGLTRLRELHLDANNISPAGLKHLRNLRELRRLTLPGSALSNANVSDLEQLSQLEVLSIRGTSDVSLTAIDELQKRLPKLSVYW